MCVKELVVVTRFLVAPGGDGSQCRAALADTPHDGKQLRGNSRVLVQKVDLGASPSQA